MSEPGGRRPDRLPTGRLAAELLAASAWFDHALLARLARRGWPALSPTRSRLFLALSGGAVRVSELAVELDVSRQAVHQLLGGLEADELVERRTDPHDRRAQQVVLTDRGRELARDAGRILTDLEGQLAHRIGADNVAALRRALVRDRGSPPDGGPRS